MFISYAENNFTMFLSIYKLRVLICVRDIRQTLIASPVFGGPEKKNRSL